MSGFLEAFERESIHVAMEDQPEEARWSVTDHPEVLNVVAQLSSSLSREFEFACEEDISQDALVMAATTPNLYECLMFEGEPVLDLFRFRLEQDLRNSLATPARRNNVTRSIYELEGEVGVDVDVDRPVAMPIRQDSPLYDRELVEALLPAAWDSQYVWGMQQENVPDQDMPRGSINKATGNTLAAHIVDIKTGWQQSPLTPKERRALLLRYGADFLEREIAVHEKCERSTIAHRIISGVGKIVSTLNGEAAGSRFIEEEEEVA